MSNPVLQDIQQSIVLNAPIEKVWRAVASSEGIAAWFMPNDFRPELGYEFQLDAGPFGMTPCKVTELSPPNRLSFEWNNDWIITFELIEQEGKTHFTLTHSGWDAANPAHLQAHSKMSFGWVGIVQALGKHVEA